MSTRSSRSESWSARPATWPSWPVLSSAVGFLVRRTVPAAAGLLVCLLIVSPLLQGQDLYWLPDMASYSLWYATAPEGAPPAPVEWLVVVGWTLAFLVPSIVAFRRRDV
ncbi:hypothetical protein ACWDKQ_31675 [Saccharopolyspora sp. NPDC000995]